MKNKSIYFILIALLFSWSCKKLVEVNAPIDELVSANVYASNSSAASVTAGLYSTLSSGENGFTGDFGLYCGLSSDELTYYSTSGTAVPYYLNSLLSTSTIAFWKEIYQSYIYTCNDILTNLPNSKVVPAVSNQLIGEAKFSRAFFNFYLTNCWGQIPLITSTDYNKNALVAKSDTSSVYALIIQDLKDAQQNLSKSYIGPDAINSTTERTFPNYWAATALLARAYLYQKDYANAFTQANAIINGGAYQLQNDINQVFKANNPEAIWQLQPNYTNFDSFDAYFYILTKAPANSVGRVTLSDFLVNSFEAGDKRRTNWVHDTTITGVNYSYAYKYKVNYPTSSKAEYTTVLRLAEQYLIRAEAQALGTGVGGGLSGARQDLDKIRERAGLPDYNGPMTATAIEAAIIHERQVELFTEFGHRWLDLKRTGMINYVMGTTGENVCGVKGGTWSNYKALWPIPQSEITDDPNLKQNTGY